MGLSPLETGQLIRELRLQRNLKQTQLAEMIPCKQALISQIENGAGTSLDTIRKIAQALNVPLGTLLEGNSGTATPPLQTATATTDGQAENIIATAGKNTMRIRLINANYKACAGQGNDNQYIEPETEGTIIINDGALSAMYDENSLMAMKVEGDSMEPLICEGDAVIFTQTNEISVQGTEYIVSYNGKTMVKAVMQNKDGYILRSANPAYKDITVTASDDFQICARVVKISPATREPKTLF